MYPSKPYVLFFFLAIGFLASLFFRFNFEFNGGYTDEYDYLFVAKQLLASHTWDSHSYIFGADFNWYILGIGEHFGGLIGARVLIGILGLISLIGLYFLTLGLWHSHTIAILSTLFLSIQSIHIFLSRFATYDMIALTFLSLTLPLFWYITETKERKHHLLLLLTIALFSLGVMSKYIVIVYFPLLLLVGLLRAPRIAFYFGIGVGTILALYVWQHFDALQTLYEVQIIGTHGANSSYQEIIQRVLDIIGVSLLLGGLAFIAHMAHIKQHLFKSSHTAIWIGLLIFALPLVAYHLNGRNMISLYKHLVYPLYFFSPAIAWMLWSVLKYFKFHIGIQLILAFLFLSVCYQNYTQLKKMENSYPDSTKIVQMRTKFPINASTTIASEDPYIARYLFFGKVHQKHIKELYWIDNNIDGKHTLDDTLSALWDRKFEYVYLNDLINPIDNKEVRKILFLRDYEKIIEIPWESTQVMSYAYEGKLEIYKRNGTPSIPMEEDRLFMQEPMKF